MIQGLDEVVAGLLSEAALAPGRAGESVKVVSERIAADARSLAPKLTGALAASIEADSSGMTAEVGPTVPYAPFVEFGTSRMSPQPFMGPATDRHEPELESEILKLVGEL